MVFPPKRFVTLKLMTSATVNEEGKFGVAFVKKGLMAVGVILKLA